MFQPSFSKGGFTAFAGKTPNVLVATTSRQFVVPATEFVVELVGGGPGAQGSGGTGGNSAGYTRKRFTNAVVGSIATIVIGAGSAGTVDTSTQPANGGNSTFTLAGFTQLVANGGQNSAGTGPGTASGGDINIQGQYGGPGNYTGSGADFGGGAGGNTMLGLGGICYQNNIARPATGFGSGGAGGLISTPSTAGSAGANGVCIISW